MDVKWLDRKLFPKALALSAALLLLITVLDILTGYELGLEPFYLLPIALVTWFGGYRWGCLGASLALACWLGADRLAGHPYSSPFYAVWAGVDRGLAFFLLMAAIGWLSATHRRLQESNRSLERSEQNFWNLFNASDIAMFRMRLDGSETLECNEKFLELVGRTREQVIGAPSAVRWEDPRAREAMVLRLQAEGQVDDFEFRMVRADGAIRRCSVSLRLFRQDRLTEGCLQDITERKEAEEALRESNDHLENLINCANAPIIVWNPEFRITRFNHAFEALTGWTEAEVRGRSLEILFPLTVKQDAMNLIRRTRTGERWQAVEIRILDLAGEVRTVLWNSATLFAADGRTPVATIAQGQDITERKRAEEALRTSEELYSKSFRSAPLLIALSRFADGRLLDVNDRYCRTLGYTREELIGRTTIDLGIVGPAERERLVGLSGSGEAAGNIEFQMHTRDGKPVPCLFSGETIEVGGQKLLISMSVDITELKRAEELERSLNARLQQAQKLESLGILAAGVAHNLNNVLAIILGTASMQGSEPGAGAGEAFQLIENACRRGREVVKSLVRFARPGLSSEAPFELHALIREVCALMESTTRNRVVIIEAFAAGPFWVSGDAGSINHALVNLCLNALDAMPCGGTLTFRTSLAAGDQVEVAVEDDGAGIAAEHLAHVLEPFYTTKEVDKGTGLGLSMVYGVVKAHGGGIEISSQPGQGTTVKIRLPRIPAPVPAGPVLAPGPAPAILTVFLVDDDEDVRFLMTRMLRKAGARQVSTFAGGEEVLEALRTGARPGLVILDQNMPGMNGTQTLERIRDLDPGLPVLISSGQPDLEALDCFNRPGVGIISKPFTLDEIEARLAQFAGAAPRALG